MTIIILIYLNKYVVMNHKVILVNKLHKFSDYILDFYITYIYSFYFSSWGAPMRKNRNRRRNNRSRKIFPSVSTNNSTCQHIS